MNYALWANVTAITHGTIIVAVIVGLLICFRHKRFRPWEAGALLVIVVCWSYFGNCPLIILEQHLREMAGQHPILSSVGFIPYYTHKLFGVNLSSRFVQHTTFFTGGAIFVSSIEWLSPVMHHEVFRMRRLFRRTKRKFA